MPTNIYILRLSIDLRHGIVSLISFRRLNVPVRFAPLRGHACLQIAGLNYDNFDRAGELLQ